MMLAWILIGGVVGHLLARLLLAIAGDIRIRDNERMDRRIEAYLREHMGPLDSTFDTHFPDISALRHEGKTAPDATHAPGTMHHSRGGPQ